MLLSRSIPWAVLLCIGLYAPAALSQSGPSAAEPAPVLTHPLATPGGANQPPQSNKRPTHKNPRTPAFKEILWDDLIPTHWNPLKEFQGMNMGMLNDGDPRATALLKRMREVWDQAPVNDKMDGAPVRIPGFVVPLEDSKEGMKEFLLVPYYGACIHSPPPPANQIIHVVSSQPIRGLRSMEAVWIQGTLQAFRHDSFMGVSGYRMQAQAVELFVEKADKKNR